MIRKLTIPFSDDNCFFCGKRNAFGLRLSFYHDDETGETFTEYVPEQHFQGQGSIFHGGLQMGLLDETMWWAGFAETGIMEAVTANANFRFLRPVFVGHPLKVVCSLIGRTDKRLKIKGRILGKEGKTCTAVRGEFRIVDAEKFEAFLSKNR